MKKVTIKFETTEREINTKGVLRNYSRYARIFDKGSEYYVDDKDYNWMFLIVKQRYANDWLKAKGHLYLNDVYQMLGIPESREGQVVGWIYEENNPIGDNFVDFGIKRYSQSNKIILDFNVDGYIIDRMLEKL